MRRKRSVRLAMRRAHLDLDQAEVTAGLTLRSLTEVRSAIAAKAAEARTLLREEAAPRESMARLVREFPRARRKTEAYTGH
jgi:septal ring factor EnvC (AmiA/AmiB activator)